MIENLFLLLLAFVTVMFMWLLWLRQGLFAALSEVEHQRAILQKDMEKRRDTVPYLLESIRAAAQPDDTWRKIAEDRHAFAQMSDFDMSKELSFEQTLNNYLQTLNVSGLAFLDAKRTILDLNFLIEKEKIALDATIAAFNEKRKQFPYSIAAFVFQFTE